MRYNFSELEKYNEVINFNMGGSVAQFLRSLVPVYGMINQRKKVRGLENAGVFMKTGARRSVGTVGDEWTELRKKLVTYFELQGNTHREAKHLAKQKLKELYKNGKMPDYLDKVIN